MLYVSFIFEISLGFHLSQPPQRKHHPLLHLKFISYLFQENIFLKEFLEIVFI